MSKSFLGVPNLPRGVRNNNPGNLVATTIGWQGKIPLPQNTDKHFEQFTEVKFGIRAMFRDLLNDISKGKNTVEKLISEYAPSFENNTTSYVNQVAQSLGLSPDEKITQVTEDFLLKLGKIIIRVENGSVVERYISDEDIKEGISIIGDTTGYGIQIGKDKNALIKKAIELLQSALLIAFTGFCLFF